MSKAIKVIDLLNKIANGEEIPKAIIYNNIIYDFNEDVGDYNVDDLYLFDNIDRLNDTVEIIEEEPEIDIQRIKEIKEVFIENATCGKDVKYLARKFNEIAKAVKQLDKQINNK